MPIPKMRGGQKMVEINIMIKEKEEKSWWENGVAFTSTECGSCCGGEPGAVWVTEDEQRRMAEHMGLSLKEYKERHTRKLFGRRSLNEAPNYDCALLRPEDKKYSVYVVRPMQCKLFPFWPSVFESRESWDFYAQTCPGMNQGKHFTRDEIEALLSQSPWADL